jgi:hypothetical protein
MVARIQGDQIFANFRQFSPFGRSFSLGSFFENGRSRPNFGATSSRRNNFENKLLGLNFG